MIFINSCSYPELSYDEIIFDDDFEDNLHSKNYDGYKTFEFNNSNVLGPFNKNGITFHLNEIPDHDYIFISFDLFIHGSWDGNHNGFPENDKADKWIFELRPGMDLYKNGDFDKFITTFSNSPCYSNWCKRQSYPDTFPSENNPYSGANEINLPRACDGYWGGKTASYTFEKSFSHKGKALVFKIYDELYQPNAIDYLGNSAELCDESWSIDNMRIRIVKYK